MIEPSTTGVTVLVRVLPRAGRPGIAGARDGALLVKVKAAPVDGAANDELTELLARALHVPRGRVTIASGARGRLKRIHVTGIDAASATRLLAARSTDPSTPLMPRHRSGSP